MSEAQTDGPIPYMERTRNYYRALGYEKDYAWAHFDAVPFTRLEVPLAETTVALLTTAMPEDKSNLDEAGRRQVWSGPVAHAPQTFNTDLAWDRESTHTDDRETFLPVNAAQALVSEGVIGGLAAHFQGVPTDYSHRKTLIDDAPEILRRLKEDTARAAILTAL